MAREEVSFARGEKATMPQDKVPGRLLVAVDTGEAYVDDTAESRVQLKDSTKLPTSGGTMTGPINMGSQKITNVATPSADSDAANLGSVKTQIKNNQYTSGTQITVDNDEHTISHSSVGSAGSVGPTQNATLTPGGTFNVPQVTTDAQGHVSSKSNRTMTMPKYTGSNGITVNGTAISHDNVGSAGSYGPSQDTSPGYAGKFTVPQITTNAQGHVTAVTNRTITLPSSQDIPEVETYTGEAPISVSGTEISHDNIGTAGSVGPTGNSTATHGGTITIPYITVDAKGHVSAKSNRTITMPAAPTTVSGNAGTATTLQTARTIDGVSFNGSANITHYGSCSTAAGTAAKVVSCAGFTRAAGARICVKFTVTNTAASPTLNVNGTGAAAIYYRGTAITASYLAANRTYEFVYNGTQYELVGDINVDNNTTYSAGTGLSLSGTTFNHKNSVTAANAGPASNSTASPGSAITVPYIAYDAQGHITSRTNRSITLSSNILDTGDILTTLSGVTSNTKVLGAKLVADAINSLNSQISTLNTNLENISNYVVEEGSNSNGKYRKWSDGALEMWGDFDRTAAISDRSGNLYSSAILSITYPIQSLTRPNINFTVTAAGAVWGKPWDSASGYLRDFSYNLLAATQWSNASYHLSYYARGTWK